MIVLQDRTSPAMAALAPPDGMESPRRQWAVFAVLLGTFLATLDAAIANIAVPVIAHEFGSTASTSIWVVNAYQLAVGVAVLPLAALGERLGYKRIFMSGVAVFTLASVACAMAPSIGALIAFRVLQGLGGACVSALTPALLRHAFPHRMIGRGISLLALVVAISSSLGPSAAAAILRVADWRWLFGVNIPVGVCVLMLTSLALPRLEGVARPFDTVGALLGGVTLTLLIIGVGGLGDRAATPYALAELGAALVFGGVLCVHTKRAAAPLVPVDLLRIPVFSLSMITSICSYAAQALALISLPFLLEHQFARSTSIAGLLITPWPLAIVFIAPIAGRLSDRYPGGVLGSIGMLVLAVGLALTATMPFSATDAQIAWRILLCGIGFSLFQTPNNRMLLTAGPRERSGAAGGMMTMARLIGMTLGAAVAALLFALSADHGGVMALVAGAVFAVAGGVASCLRLVSARR
ncbi:MFS transporter [Paraburkholderia sp. ZP32-5]|uniref:MFS transporter n=1 Tax=Paraburkholderia sp. ZP32-5 TaxID=2883245 RepID=UPI001F3D02F7|nr:MFS transporter [Paraburkholderia sp. ZP32-5]